MTSNVISKFTTKVEEVDKFINSPYKTPEVLQYINVFYLVKGITLSLSKYNNRGRLKVSGMTVKEYMNIHNHAKLTQEVYEEMIAYGKESATIQNGLSYQKDFIELDIPTTASYFMARDYTSSVYLANLEGNNIDFLSDTSKYESAYIFQCIHTEITYLDKDPQYSAKELARLDLANRLLGVYYDMEYPVRAESFEDAIKKLKHIKEGTDMSIGSAIESLEYTATSHRVWNLLTADEIITALAVLDDANLLDVDEEKIRTFKKN